MSHALAWSTLGQIADKAWSEVLWSELVSRRPRPRVATASGAGVTHGASQTLIQRARAGDEAAFGEVFRAYQRDVARLCRRMLGSEVAAEDATSEVFLRVRRGFDGYAPDRPFRTWLLGIAGHYCIDQLRRRSTERRLFEPRDLDHAGLADPGPSPVRQLARAEERRELLSAIEALPAKYRLPLVLRYFAELDYEAIAGILGVTRNQVGTLIFRAKRRLREELGPRLMSGDGR